MGRRVLEVSHEWGSHALRDVDTGDRVDPASLPLPDSVVQRLGAWAARWDLTFDVADPDQIRVDGWVLEQLGKDGAHLWKAVMTTLPPRSYEITYRHRDTLYRKPSELPPAWW